MSRGRASKHITLDISLMQEAQAYADRYGLPFSYVNERALRMYLDMWKLREAERYSEVAKQLQRSASIKDVQS